MQIAFRGATHVGARRNINEDAFVIDEAWRACAVADGQGGCGVAGRRVAELALVSMIEGLENARGQLAYAPESVLGRMLARAVDHANRRILESVAADPLMLGAATTVTAAVFGGERAYLAHVGDSRAYLIRAGEITQLTEDHLLIKELVRVGRITEAEAAESPFKHIITRVVGAGEKLDVDTAIVPLRDGDRLLFVSDGVWRHLDDGELLELVSGEGAIDRLIERTLEEGAHDNLAIVIAEAKDRR